MPANRKHTETSTHRTRAETHTVTHPEEGSREQETHGEDTLVLRGAPPQAWRSRAAVACWPCGAAPVERPCWELTAECQRGWREEQRQQIWRQQQICSNHRSASNCKDVLLADRNIQQILTSFSECVWRFSQMYALRFPTSELSHINTVMVI